VDLVSFGHTGLLGGRPVISEAVGLDNQVVVGEEEVDLVVEDPVFRQGHRKSRGESDRPEQHLQI
jgi:hypothetical protein